MLNEPLISMKIEFLNINIEFRASRETVMHFYQFYKNSRYHKEHLNLEVVLRWLTNRNIPFKTKFNYSKKRTLFFNLKMYIEYRFLLQRLMHDKISGN